MPSAYAHYRLGQEVKKQMDMNMKMSMNDVDVDISMDMKADMASREAKVIEAFPQLFFTGLQGPDILFYYRPLLPGRINRLGYGMHKKPGKGFFSRSRDIINGHAQKEAALSYLYGVICHFALDVTCHGYIAEKIKESGLSHVEIEMEFDRELLVRDGFSPFYYPVLDKLSLEDARIIGEFYGNVPPEKIQRAAKGMNQYNRLLRTPSERKRKWILFVLKMTGAYKKLHGLVINEEGNPACGDSTEKLTELYGEARELALRLIREYGKFLSGEKPLDEIYRYTFGRRLYDKEA